MPRFACYILKLRLCSFYASNISKSIIGKGEYKDCYSLSDRTCNCIYIICTDLFVIFYALSILIFYQSFHCGECAEECSPDIEVTWEAQRCDVKLRREKMHSAPQSLNALLYYVVI